MRIMESKETKMHRQFMAITSEITKMIRETSSFGIACKISLFETENAGTFIVNKNGGHNYTCSRLSKNLWDRLEIRRGQLRQEEIDTNYLLAEVNKNSFTKIIIQ